MSAAAAGCANPHAPTPMAETRAELRAVSKKLSSCEAALEGEGAYLGIRDPVRGQLLCVNVYFPLFYL